METRVMGVVGARKRRAREASCAAPVGSSAAQASVANRSDSRQCEKTPEPAGSIHGHRGIQLRYHTEEGMKGEAPGYVTASNRVFIVTSSMLPLGTSVILDVNQEVPSNETQTMTGRVTSTFPVADEFGFPSGIGVSMTQGFEMPDGFLIQDARI